MTAKEWAEGLGITPASFVQRLRKYGYSDKTFKRQKNQYQSPNERLITWNGKTLSVANWARHLGINERTLRGRLRRYGMKALEMPPANNAVKKPKQSRKPKCNVQTYTWNDKTMTAKEWAKELDISLNRFYGRVARFGICAKAFEQVHQTTTVTWKGETLTINQWAEKLQIHNYTFRQRLQRHGLSPKTLS